MWNSVQKISKVSTKLSSEFDYKLQSLQHRTKLPALSPADALVIKGVREEGVFITSLEALGIPSTQRMPLIACCQACPQLLLGLTDNMF